MLEVLQSTCVTVHSPASKHSNSRLHGEAWVATQPLEWGPPSSLTMHIRGVTQKSHSGCIQHTLSHS